MTFSGLSPDGLLPEIIELKKSSLVYWGSVSS